MKNIDEWHEWDWYYASQDPKALNLLRERLYDTVSKYGLISYTDLVKDITFKMAGVNNGKSFQITPDNWTGLYRRIIGNMLGWLSLESYTEHGFWCSALVIARNNSQPSDIFFNWMVDLEVLKNSNEMTVLPFWSEQVHKAHKYCRKAMKNAKP